ncbi:GPI mannosyltransferase 4 [Cylas formicarius]|uniref:GPI mannosyltransferase 4 n=1 Tax=Cylas formicarius TaxID=197179 RepID=UPI0029583ED5|nr:GPI mannosyltransferase 4 [Cylas formicarius]
MKYEELRWFRHWYLFFAALRVFLVMVPQTGYIHPDEYFQSLEVLIGKIFDVENNPPWEFNATLPIRSMVIPYFTIGMGYIFLRDVNNLTMKHLSLNVIQPYFLLVVPRFLMCALSFVVDYCLYKICLNNNEPYKARFLIMSSSYVILVYGCRTFSNTFEMVLFSALLYFVSESLTFSNILSRKREYINYRYDKSETLQEKAKFHKLKLYLTSDSYRNCLIISTVTVIGFFNRPTFLAFAVMPVFFWIYRGFGSKSTIFMQFHTRILFFALCCLPTFIFFILVDSFYYGYITWGEIGVLDVSINNFVVTPVNFLKYNSNSQNLAEHGLHPRFLHFLVNVPLLFNVLGIVALCKIAEYVFLCFRRNFQRLPSIRSIRCLMTASFLAPVSLLSIFPHQEPRFLIPSVLPLVYLHGKTILPEPDDALAKISEGAPPTTHVKKSRQFVLFRLWILVNVLCTLFFGFLHGGGVYSAVSYLEKDLRLAPISTEFHILTSHIYPLPESFLLQKASNKLYTSGNLKYAVNKRTYLYEEGSKDLDVLIDKIEVIKSATIKRAVKNFRIYLLIPSSLRNSAGFLLNERSIHHVELENFQPHLSVEAFPDLSNICTEFTSIFYKECRSLPVGSYLMEVLKSFQLLLLEIK